MRTGIPQREEVEGGQAMTLEKLIEVLRFYDAHLAQTAGVEPERLGDVGMRIRSKWAMDALPLRRHLRWMVKECLEVHLKDVRKPAPDLQTAENTLNGWHKALRWLGYIQGELRALGDFSIDDLRSHSRTVDEGKVATRTPPNPEWAALDAEEVKRARAGLMPLPADKVETMAEVLEERAKQACMDADRGREVPHG